MKDNKHQNNIKTTVRQFYVGSSLMVHNPLFSVGKLCGNKLMGRVYWSIRSKINARNAIESYAPSGSEQGV